MTPDKPNPYLLDRAGAEAFVEENLSSALELVRDIVNYGTNLVLRCLRSSERDVVALVAIGTLLKQVVGMLDSAEVLLRAGAVAPAHLQLRALFEASLHLDFIVQEDTQLRCRAFYVANLRAMRLHARRFQLGSRQERTYLPNVDWARATSEQTRRERDEIGRADEATINEILAESEYRDIDGEFERVAGAQGYDPPWYQVVPPQGKRRRTIRSMATGLKRMVEYELIYAPGSEIMHGSTYQHHARIDRGEVSYIQLRDLSDFDMVISAAIPTVVHTYMKVLGHFRSGEQSSLARKYIEEWRDRFRRLPRVRVNAKISRT